MTKLRTIGIAAVAALALVAGRTQAAEGVDAGWNSNYGMIFSLQNVFQNAGILDEFAGGVGLQKNLAADRALRLSVQLSRFSNPAVEGEYTPLNAAIPTTTKYLSVPAGYTSAYSLDLRGSYIVRMTTAAISPYVGAGARVAFEQGSRKWTDDVNPLATTIESEDSQDRTWSVGGVGQLGVEWRIHNAVSLFAEYGLTLDFITATSSRYEYTEQSKATGLYLAGSEREETSSTKYFNFATGLQQGGQLGLVAFF